MPSEITSTCILMHGHRLHSRKSIFIQLCRELIMHVSVTEPSGASGTRRTLSHSPPPLALSHLELWCYKHKDKSPCLPAIAVPREREVTPPVAKTYRRACASFGACVQSMSYARQVRMMPVLLRRMARGPSETDDSKGCQGSNQEGFPSVYPCH